MTLTPLTITYNGATRIITISGDFDDLQIYYVLGIETIDQLADLLAEAFQDPNLREQILEQLLSGKHDDLLRELGLK